MEVASADQLNDESMVAGFGHHPRISAFYFVKMWPYEDQTIKTKITEAETLAKKMDHDQLEIVHEIKAKMHEQDSINRGLENRGYKYIYRSTKEKMAMETAEMNNLKQYLDKMSFSNHAYQSKGVASADLEEQPNIHKLHHILHGSKNMAKENSLLREVLTAMEKQVEDSSGISKKELLDRRILHLYYEKVFYINNSKEKDMQLLRDIKQAECDREKAIADAPVKGTIWNSMGCKKIIQARIQELNDSREELRKRQLQLRRDVKKVKKELQAIEKDIAKLRKRNMEIYLKKDEAYGHIFHLRKQQDEINAWYYEHILNTQNARKLAKQKDTVALEEISNREVEKFMRQWNKCGTFRDEYEKRKNSARKRFPVT